MNYYGLFESLHIDTSKLDEKKDHTSHKIKYVSAYVRQWLYVVANRPNVRRINFIDCMCNAGLYKDGDLTTALEVLLIFFNYAVKHNQIEFHLFLNDISAERMKICQAVEKTISVDSQKPSNVMVHYDNQDVNTYLSNSSLLNKYLLGNASTIFYIDPYDLGTVIIENVVNISRRYYCEIIFNVFTSDLVRNKDDDRIKRCLGIDDITDKTDLLEYIAAKLKVGGINYCFNYEFRNRNNTELYRIVFATPHKKGLEKLKDAIWETFDGKEFFRNPDPSGSPITLFTECGEDLIQLDFHASRAKRLLMNEFIGKDVEYSVIELFLLEKTILKASDFLSDVIKPLIQNGIIRKMGLVGKSNYKEDTYRFIEENE